MDLFEFTLLGDCRESCMFTLMSFIKSGFLTIISSNTLSTPLSSSSIFGTSMLCMLVCLLIPHRSFRLPSLFFIRLPSLFFNLFLLFLSLSNFHCHILKYTDSFFCLIKSALDSLGTSSLQLLYKFQLWNFFLISFQNFNLLIFPFSSHIVLTFYTHSFNSLSIFEIVFLKSSSTISDIWLFSAIASVDLTFFSF